MANLQSLVNSLSEKLNLTRRGFVKGTLALGAAASLYGCSKGDGEGETVYTGGGLFDAVPEADLSNPQIYWAACAHNCGVGVRCASKLHVVKGRVVRVTSDDSDIAYDGSVRNKDQWNDSRALACAKGRSYKYRLYHPGRLKYALKQTKERGDVTGFVRITSEQAMKEIATKFRAIRDKYGPGAIYNSYGTATSYAGTYSKMVDARSALTTFYGSVGSTVSDYSFHQHNYAWGLTGHPAQGNYGKTGIGGQISAISQHVKNIVSWGSNVLTTNNTVAYPYIRASEDLKARGGKIYHISPEFVDTGVTIATDWVQIRNYTDTALIMSMLYEMLINTFNEDGSIKANAWLDVNYLDTMVYGFFDSPAYYVKTKDPDAGNISLAAQTGAGWRKVDAVPAGMSLSAYVMGSDTRLQKAKYLDGQNYTALQLGTAGTGFEFRNMSGCALTVKGKPAHECTDAEINASKYLYKKDLMKPKTAEWAEAICGTPAATIRELAKLYCTPEAHPILNEWCGGLQKQDNGVVNLFAISTLMCVTKTFGLEGEGLYGGWASQIETPGTVGTGKHLVKDGTDDPVRPPAAAQRGVSATISVKEWFNGIKVAFHDVLKAKGYTGKHLPEYDPEIRYVNDDGGAKALVKFEVIQDTEKALTYVDPDDGLTYYKWEKDESEKPIFVGRRMILQQGGGIQLNQHFNTNDNAEMYRLLPLASTNPADPDTFCLVTFDNFLSPTARFADYVLPSTIVLEAGDWTSVGGNPYYRPPVVKALGEAKDGWRYAFEAYKAQVELGGKRSDNTDIVDDVHWKYVRSTKEEGYKSVEVLSMEIVRKAIEDPKTRFFGMTPEEVFDKQFTPRKNEVPASTVATPTSLRTKLDAYLSNETDRREKPFIFSPSVESVESKSMKLGNEEANIAESEDSRPAFAGRMQVYNYTAVWDYERRFSKWHGWLPKEKRGQSNADYEGDKKILPIPIYFNFEDCFAEAYGAFKNNKSLSELVPNGLTLSTTHDRYRVHSTHAENPFLKELTHRVRGGKYASGNDWKEYAVMPERHWIGATASISRMISSAVNEKNMATASWHEIWMNTEDAAERGIVDGDLVRVTNPIGAVRVIARVTNRCIRGHVNLHQGGWYDPNPIDGVDDGGCANTLMSCKPSRYDNGNSQQMAFVSIKKETNF